MQNIKYLNALRNWKQCLFFMRMPCIKSATNIILKKEEEDLKIFHLSSMYYLLR